MADVLTLAGIVLAAVLAALLRDPWFDRRRWAAHRDLSNAQALLANMEPGTASRALISGLVDGLAAEFVAASDAKARFAVPLGVRLKGLVPALHVARGAFAIGIGALLAAGALLALDVIDRDDSAYGWFVVALLACLIVQVVALVTASILDRRSRPRDRGFYVVALTSQTPVIFPMRERSGADALYENIRALLKMHPADPRQATGWLRLVDYVFPDDRPTLRAVKPTEILVVQLRERGTDPPAAPLEETVFPAGGFTQGSESA